LGFRCIVPAEVAVERLCDVESAAPKEPNTARDAEQESAAGDEPVGGVIRAVRVACLR